MASKAVIHINACMMFDDSVGFMGNGSVGRGFAIVNNNGRMTIVNRLTSSQKNAYSLRSVAWKDDAAASGAGWSFSGDGTIGIFSLSSGQLYDFTSAGVSDVAAGTEIGFGAFGGATGGELLRSFTISLANGSPTPAEPEITSISLSGNTATLTITGDDSVGYWCASSTDLTGFITAEAILGAGTTNPIASPFNTSGGILTFDIDVSGDSRLFFRIQDADPEP